MNTPVEITFLFIAIQLISSTLVFGRSIFHCPISMFDAQSNEINSSNGPKVTVEGIILHSKLQNIEACISPLGAVLRSVSEHESRGDFSITPAMIGRGVRMKSLSLTGVVSAQDGHSVFLDKEQLIERFSAGPDGIRQDFIIAKRIGGTGPLTLTLSVEGANVSTGKSGVTISLPGGRTFVYGNLNSMDAKNKILIAKMEVIDEHSLRITLDDSGAKYPVTIDPTITDEDWIALNTPTFPWPNTVVYALHTDQNGVLYAGGDFGIRRWNGECWEHIGQGITWLVRAITSDENGHLYAGGKSIEKWDGTSWSRLGASKIRYGEIFAMTPDGKGNIYFGGNFPGIDNVKSNLVIKWNGTAWLPLDTGIVNGDSSISSGQCRVQTLLVDKGGILHAGGNFSFKTRFGNCIVQWDGKSWQSKGSVTGEAVSLAMDTAGTVYAGGRLTGNSSNIYGYHFLKWDNTMWTGCSKGVTSVTSLASDKEGNIYVSGGMSDSVTGSSGQVMKYIPGGGQVILDSIWYPFSKPIQKDINVLVVNVEGQVFAGGKSSNSAYVRCLRTPASKTWYTMESGIRTSVNAIIYDSTGKIYVGGKFSEIAGYGARNIICWDGSQWRPLGAGIIGEAVYSLALDRDGMLYAGGIFDTAGNVSANSIALWDGNAWHSLGSGIMSKQNTGDVRAIAIGDSGILLAGGAFDSAGSVAAKNIAQWDGKNWSSLGPGIAEPKVFSITYAGNESFYVGGLFSYIDTVATENLAKWDGKNWSVFPKGPSGIIFATALDSKGNLYAGGLFRTVDGITARQMAKWNGTAWAPVGSGITFHVNDQVHSIAIGKNDEVYCGGSLTGNINRNIARFEDPRWSKLGTGTNAQVNVIALCDSILFVGGDFDTAGSKYSPILAKVNVDNQVLTQQHPKKPEKIPVPFLQLRNSILKLNGHLPSDQITISTLSGRCLLKTTGVSKVDLGGISAGPLLVRLSRSGKIISTGLVLLQ